MLCYRPVLALKVQLWTFLLTNYISCLIALFCYVMGTAVCKLLDIVSKSAVSETLNISNIEVTMAVNVYVW